MTSGRVDTLAEEASLPTGEGLRIRSSDDQLIDVDRRSLSFRLLGLRACVFLHGIPLNIYSSHSGDVPPLVIARLT